MRCVTSFAMVGIVLNLSDITPKLSTNDRLEWFDEKIVQINVQNNTLLCLEWLSNNFDKDFKVCITNSQNYTLSRICKDKYNHSMSDYTDYKEFSPAEKKAIEELLSMCNLDIRLHPLKIISKSRS